MRLRVALLASLSALAVLPASAWAHQSSIVYLELVVRGRDVDGTLQLSSRDLFEAVGVERDRPVTRDETLRGRERLERYVMERVHVAAGPASCEATPGGLDFTDASDGFFAVLHLTWHCPRLVGEARITYDLFFNVDPRHEGIARLRFDDGASSGPTTDEQQVFRDGHRTLTLRRDLSAWDHARDYLLLGVEHIFTGYDHLAFLFGLLALAGAAGLRAGGRRVLAVVTAFTVAHSVTLCASALGVVALPSRVVEPAIALSIAYVGVENLVGTSGRWRWLLVFCFGLIHGFGFASALREIGLPEKGLLLSLVSFNVGVELGQLAVVALALPVLAVARVEPDSDGRSPFVAHARALAVVVGCGATAFLLLRGFGASEVPLATVTCLVAPALVIAARRWGYDAVVRRGGSWAITALAVFWFFERVLQRSWLGGWLG